MTRIGLVVILIFLCLLVFLGGAITHNLAAQAHDQGYAEGKVQNTGRPMPYKDVPAGHYRVVAVVENQFGTAVIERDDLDASTMTPEKGDLLVTDMVSSMLQREYTFTVGDATKKQ